MRSIFDPRLRQEQPHLVELLIALTKQCHGLDFVRTILYYLSADAMHTALLQSGQQIHALIGDSLSQVSKLRAEANQSTQNQLKSNSMLKKIIGRIQRNHGLEHATIHVLSEKHQGFSAQGNSNHRGFHLNIYSNSLSYDDVIEAVNEAFTRMKGGEHTLAIHPNCGTVLLTTATMTTLAAQAAFAVESVRQGKERTPITVFTGGFSSAILATVIALITSRSVGLHLQEKYTTEGDLGEMQLVQVKQMNPSAITSVFKALLTGGSKVQAQSYFVETIG